MGEARRGTGLLSGGGLMMPVGPFSDGALKPAAGERSRGEVGEGGLGNCDLYDGVGGGDGVSLRLLLRLRGRLDILGSRSVIGERSRGTFVGLGVLRWLSARAEARRVSTGL